MSSPLALSPQLQTLFTTADDDHEAHQYAHGKASQVKFDLPAVESLSDAQLAEKDLPELLQRILSLQQTRSLTYSLYHQAFSALIQAAEQIALEGESNDGESARGNHSQNHQNHHRCCDGADSSVSRPIDPQKVKPAFEAFSKISGAVARNFQLISASVLQVEHLMLQRAASSPDHQPGASPSPADLKVRTYALWIRKLQEFEKRKLETTVRFQAIVSRHRVIQVGR